MNWFELDPETLEAIDQPWRPSRARRRGLRPHMRLFRREPVERMTRSHPLTPLAVLAAPAAALLALPLWGPSHVATHALAVSVGALVWTLFEYVLHRFVLHLPGDGRGARTASFLMHGHHHVDPEDPHRLVATPMQWLSALALFGGVATLVAGTWSGLSALGGFAAAYLVYEWIHWSAHHRVPRTRWGRALRAHHLRHHFGDHERAYGISSPLWDAVFRTLPLQPAPRDDARSRH